MEDYKDIRESLMPRRDIKASGELRHRVRLALDRDRAKHIRRTLMWGSFSLGAVAAILIFILLPSGLSARDILAEAIEALRNVGNIEMVVDIRTRPVENFRYIDIHEDFVSHRIEAAGADSTLRWRIDKGGRIAVGNREDIYLWMPSLNLGMHLRHTDKEDVIGYLANLLTPYRILETELAGCTKDNGTEYKVTKLGNDIHLTVHATPQGNFENTYLLNTSIAESENIRRYVIDAETKRLKRATVSVLAGNRETVVLKISALSYNLPQEDICRLPDDIHFIETENLPSGIRGLSAEETAAVVLNAFSDWDRSVLDKVLRPEISDIYRNRFHGAKLVSVGSSFTSGSENSTFVPYTLRLRDGSIQRHNIALQKTDSAAWIVAGGL